MIPWSLFQTRKARLGDHQRRPQQPHLLLLLQHQFLLLLFHRHQFQHLSAPPLRAQILWCRCCRASTMAYAWWCRVFTTWLSIGPLLAWRISWNRWHGQESSLLLWGEVRLLQPRSLSRNISQTSHMKPCQRWLHEPHQSSHQLWRSLRMKKASRTQIMQQI